MVYVAATSGRWAWLQAHSGGTWNRSAAKVKERKAGVGGRGRQGQGKQRCPGGKPVVPGGCFLVHPGGAIAPSKGAGLQPTMHARLYILHACCPCVSPRRP